MENKNYYELLGLTEEDKKLDKEKFQKKLKSQYRKKSKEFHPDSQHSKSEEDKKISEEKFKKINEANTILSEKRELYDKFGEDLGKNQGFGDQGGGFNDIDLNDVINRMRQAHGFGGGFQQNPREQVNINVNIKIDLIDAINEKGVNKKFKYNKKVVCNSCHGIGGDGKIQCSNCQGSGMETTIRGNMVFQTNCRHCNSKGYIIKNPCLVCNATGLKTEQEQIDVHIPAGALFTGVTIPGKGNEMLINGSKHTGDLFIQVQANNHPEYQMDQQGNLHKELEVSVIDCIVGEQVKFKYLDNSEKIFKLKQGSKEGEVYRLNNIGITTPNGGRTNLHIHLKQKYPTKLTDDQIKTLKTIKV